jgi:glycosyltransferase involved in cell wall biosynthesis
MEANPVNRITISVIIPVLNEEVVVGRCLSCLARQSLHADQFEVIVVDSGSVDRTLEVVRAFEGSLNLTILEKTAVHISALRNVGAASAKGQFLAFLDADCLAPPDWLRTALDLLPYGDGGVMGAFYTIPENSSWVARAWYESLPYLRKGPVSYVPSGTLFITRKVFISIGGFDEALPTSEDFEFCQRVAAARYSVLAFPSLSTVHLGTPQTLLAFYRKQRWHGNGIRTAFFNKKMRRGFAKTVLQTLHTLLGVMACALTLPVALLAGDLVPLTVASMFLLLGATLLAAHAAVQQKRGGFLIPLTILYLVYGIARSLSFLGLSGKRAVGRTTGSSYGSRTESAHAE